MKIKKKSTQLILFLIFLSVFILGIVLSILFHPNTILSSVYQAEEEKSADYQTDIKVINLGDEEPENEFFAYRVTKEDDERMLEEAHKKMEEDLANRKLPTDEELEETANRLKEEGAKFDNNWNYIKQLTRDTIVKYNGSEKVKEIEDAYEKSIDKIEDKNLGTSKECLDMYDLWLTTIEEHEKEMDRLVIGMIMTSISPVPMKLFVESNPEYNYVLEKYNKIEKSYPNIDLELMNWCETN